jgi:hypothetical protein
MHCYETAVSCNDVIPVRNYPILAEASAGERANHSAGEWLKMFRRNALSAYSLLHADSTWSAHWPQLVSPGASGDYVFRLGAI